MLSIREYSNTDKLSSPFKLRCIHIINTRIEKYKTKNDAVIVCNEAEIREHRLWKSRKWQPKKLPVRLPWKESRSFVCNQKSLVWRGMASLGVRNTGCGRNNYHILKTIRKKLGVLSSKKFAFSENIYKENFWA